MPFIPVPFTAQVELFFLQDGQQLENTLYFTRADTYDVAELTALANAIIAWWTAELLPLTSNTVQLRAVKATSLQSASAPAVEVAPASSLFGSATSPALPNNVTIAIKFLTNFRGRWARGRNYVIGLVENVVTANAISQAHADALQDAYNTLTTTTYVNATYDWVVVSRQFENTPRVEGFASSITSAVLTDLTVDSQRRRLPGRGR